MGTSPGMFLEYLTEHCLRRQLQIRRSVARDSPERSKSRRAVTDILLGLPAVRVLRAGHCRRRLEAHAVGKAQAHPLPRKTPRRPAHRDRPVHQIASSQILSETAGTPRWRRLQTASPHSRSAAGARPTLPTGAGGELLIEGAVVQALAGLLGLLELGRVRVCARSMSVAFRFCQSGSGRPKQTL